jgi:hypothetical protein
VCAYPHSVASSSDTRDRGSRCGESRAARYTTTPYLLIVNVAAERLYARGSCSEMTIPSEAPPGLTLSARQAASAETRLWSAAGIGPPAVAHLRRANTGSARPFATIPHGCKHDRRGSGRLRSGRRDFSIAADPVVPVLAIARAASHSQQLLAPVSQSSAWSPQQPRRRRSCFSSPPARSRSRASPQSRWRGARWFVGAAVAAMRLGMPQRQPTA